MRNILHTTTIENKLPVMAVENDCIISKNAEITVCYRLELPEVFSLCADDYESMHRAWVKALRVFPSQTIVHKQDRFVRQKYSPQWDSREQPDLLDRAFERHFNERDYMTHSCHVFFTKSSKERMHRTSLFSTLSRSGLIPCELQDSVAVEDFMEKAEQAAAILRESGFFHLTRLTQEDILGKGDICGLLERYLTLSEGRDTVLQDIEMDTGMMRVGDRHLCLHTISDTASLPHMVSTDSRAERWSSSGTDCRLSFAAPVGVMLSCNHIYNQYVFIGDTANELRSFEARTKRLHALSRYSRANQINREWVEDYLNEAHSKGLMPVRCHCNVLVWTDDKQELNRLKTETGAAIARMGCVPRHNTIDLPVLFWAGIPGNAGDFPAEETFHTFAEQAACLFTGESCARGSSSTFGIRLTDRLNGNPLFVDISDEPMRKGVTTNRNKFILGPSGSGKSFFTNHMVRQYYNQGTHIVLVDTGHSYEGLCRLINSQTCGKDGVYLTYRENDPIAFNPFRSEDGTCDIEKRESIKTLLLTLWKREDEAPTRAEEVALSNAVGMYLDQVTDGALSPSFNTFYEFVGGAYRRRLEQQKVREKDFDIENFLNVLEPYYKGGEYDYLLNADNQADLLSKRFIVFELDNIRDHPVLLPVVTLIIMETFISKMRRLEGVRKMILIEECWKAIAKEGMASYIKYLFKTVRKYFGEAVVVTQEADDIISSPIVRESIIRNADCKILLDQRKYRHSFGEIRSLLGISEKEEAQIMSMNLSNHPGRCYKEVWIGLGGIQSAVYATEVSRMEYYTYTTEQKEKQRLRELTARMGGDMEAALQVITRQETASQADERNRN